MLLVTFRNIVTWEVRSSEIKSYMFSCSLNTQPYLRETTSIIVFFIDHFNLYIMSLRSSGISSGFTSVFSSTFVSPDFDLDYITYLLVTMINALFLPIFLHPTRLALRYGTCSKDKLFSSIAFLFFLY